MQAITSFTRNAGLIMEFTFIVIKEIKEFLLELRGLCLIITNV